MMHAVLQCVYYSIDLFAGQHGMQPCCSTVVHAFGRTDVLLYATAALTSVTAVITSNAYVYDTYTYMIDFITWNYKLKFLSLHA